MRNLLIRLTLLAILSVAFTLFVPYLVAQANRPGQGGPPKIPHATEGRADCISCHEKGLNSAPKFPPDHTGRTNEMCVMCHQPGTAAPAAGSMTPAAGATPAATLVGTAPTIPHTLEGRDQCLACHQTGVGGAPKTPASHAGRTNDQCRACHQPKAVAPVVVPTRVPHVPAAANQNSCVDCHQSLGGKSAQVVKQWTSSIHAARGVFCVDCHGGDSTKAGKDEAMAATAGFVGKPSIQDTPALCASCHARVDLMRQFDIPTDQYAQYQSSVHGQKLAQGDTNVATCFVCHDEHGTKDVKDPSASVYPENVPALCGGCHSNAQLMKQYNIPTNQYELYKKSVHGIALLEKQDPRAPSCATCHGTHGAAPPGFAEVANVCGSCHTATQDYYLKSQHASNAPGTPKCVTCHGRYDVMPASEAMFASSDARGCGSCHKANTPGATALEEISGAITSAAKNLDDASNAIKRASGTGLIVAPEEVRLADAKTNLITARAAQHTLSIDTVRARTDKSIQISKEIQTDAEKAIADSVFRRQAMVIGLAVAALAIGCLYMIRQELYRQLPPKE